MFAGTAQKMKFSIKDFFIFCAVNHFRNSEEKYQLKAANMFSKI